MKYKDRIDALNIIFRLWRECGDAEGKAILDRMYMRWHEEDAK